MSYQPPPPTATELATARAHAKRQAETEALTGITALERSASLAVVLGWLIAIGGMLIGAAIAASVEERPFGSDEHPYIAQGIAVGLAAIAVGAVVSLFGYWAAAWAGKARAEVV